MTPEQLQHGRDLASAHEALGLPWANANVFPFVSRWHKAGRPRRTAKEVAALAALPCEGRAADGLCTALDGCDGKCLNQHITCAHVATMGNADCPLCRFFRVGSPILIPPVSLPEIWGLLYTNHVVPDAVLAAMLASVRLAGMTNNRLIGVGHRSDSRFPTAARWIIKDTTHWIAEHPGNGWVPAIYEQMNAGLLAIPCNALVCCLEHDVLYPPDYFSLVAEQAIDPATTYCWPHIRHLDVQPNGRDGFWDCDVNGTYTFTSGMSARRDTLLANVREKLALWYSDKTKIGGFEPTGKAWAIIKGVGVQPLSPLIDIRHGRNASQVGYHKPVEHTYDRLPVWGRAADLRARLRG